MWLTALMLTVSNVFMTIAWYGHLKFDSRPLWLLILASWGIAFFEYCLVIPANRHGFASGLTLGQLKVMQEVITLVVFAGFAALVMGEKLKWNHAAAFVCLIGAVGFMFADKFRAA
ncbi:MAG TPA: DMT family protein [Caulobacteraceae bacterium]|nr:DMT family protein [Caulobacteraceae bacterium]